MQRRLKLAAVYLQWHSEGEDHRDSGAHRLTQQEGGNQRMHDVVMHRER